MTATRLYLDWNAGAPLRPAVRDRLVSALSRTGNASSVHGEGRAARAAIEAARVEVAGLVGADPAAVTFTSGGTEANVTVLAPDWTRDGRAMRFGRLLVSGVEHPSVARGGRFAPADVETLPVDGDGVVRLDVLERRLETMSADGVGVLVSVMVANNETGVLQPIAAIAEIVHRHGGLMHADAVQAAGKLPLDLGTLGADVITLSAHKIGGPQGVGAIARRSRATAFPPLLTGGGQEGYARAGTEPAAAIEGFGVAAALANDDLNRMETVRACRDAAEAGIRRLAPDALVFSAGAERLPNTLAFAVPGMSAETAVIAFDLAGVAVSSGSACSSGKVTRSATLTAMGLPPQLAAAGVRVSFGPDATDAEVARFIEVFERVHSGMSKGRSPQAA